MDLARYSLEDASKGCYGSLLFVSKKKGKYNIKELKGWHGFRLDMYSGAQITRPSSVTICN